MTRPKGATNAVNVFLSYASDNCTAAEGIAERLRLENHDVFFDRDSLESGQGYDERICHEIEACDLFVFLITPASVAESRYTRTELSFARQKWRSVNDRILPVMVCATDPSSIPEVLKAVGILSAEGNLAAEVVARVAAIARSRNVRVWLPAVPGRRAMVGVLAVGVVLASGLYYRDWLLPSEVAPAAVRRDTEQTTDPAAAACQLDLARIHCDLDLARRICMDQKTNAARLDRGDTMTPANVASRQRVYLYGTAIAAGRRDRSQLRSLLENVKHWVNQELDSAPSMKDPNSFFDRPTKLKTEYESNADALLVMSTQLNPPFNENGVLKRGGDSWLYYGREPMLSVSFTLPDNRFAEPFALHRAAILYSRAQLSERLSDRRDLLAAAWNFVQDGCGESVAP